MREALAFGDVLDRDRKTVSLKKLTGLTHIKSYKFILSPFAEVISAHQAVVMVNLKASKIDPYFHDRVFALVI